MSKVIKPIDYVPLLDMRQTERGIKLIKEFFQQNLSTELRLRRVTAPLFVLQGLGINDDLNGVQPASSSGPGSRPMPSIRPQRAVILYICSLVRAVSGANRPSPMPFTMPRKAAQAT